MRIKLDCITAAMLTILCHMGKNTDFIRISTRTAEVGSFTYACVDALYIAVNCQIKHQAYVFKIWRNGTK